MGSKKQIVVVRHPEKDGDKITARGAMQAWAAAEYLGKRFRFVGVSYSGAHRTEQAARVMMAALDMDDSSTSLFEDRGFHFQQVMDASFGTGAEGRDKFMAALGELKAAHDGAPTVAQALALDNALGRYTQMGRRAMMQALFHTAGAMVLGDFDTVLVLCHSPLTELASLHPEETPFGLGEADAIAYTLEGQDDGWAVTASELIKAPLEGKPL